MVKNIASGLYVLFMACLIPVTTALADSSVSFSGFLKPSSPSGFNLADLQTYAGTNPNSVKTVTVAGDTYTGVSLSSYLASYVATDPSVPKNDILRDYVTATSSGGAQTVYSLGELNSSFGNENAIIAYSDSNGSLSTPSIIAADGANVQNLTSLQVGHLAYTPGSGGVSSQFTIDGAVANITTYNSSNFPGSLATQTVSVSTPPLTAGTSFSGVSIWDLLNLAGVDTSSANILHEYVVATGTDGYQTVFSLAELDPLFGNNNDLIAYATNSGSLGGSGFARVVVPADVAKAGRYVSNLNELTVISVAAVPLPSSSLFMFSGLLAMIMYKSKNKLAIA
ncbi:hypothetical protein KEF85_10095 [Methylomonas paludis]|uniref:Uncharacterized protein n=1 Tax=Methylomonas paludis TaxID=1173101 RepID=A0A975R7X2_9GAMM|nr:hypothetical protein [Methylomonas paludis]QWF69725.1 hypothetical protein KEF85_10095 [Methylomonas paludis]